MLDQLSGGRLEVGVGRGVSPIESRIFGLTGIEQSRERYRETLDVFFAACRSPLLDFTGRHHEYRGVELHNRPVQQPYPPLWFPSSNRESIAFTARHGYHTALMARTADSRALFNEYREIWERHRHDAGRHNGHVAHPFLAKTQHLVIAENGAEAERLGVQAYDSWKAHINHLTRREGKPATLTLDAFSDDSVQRLIAGTPQTVVERLQEMIDATGLNYLLCIPSFGNLPPSAAMRSLELFAAEVMPKLPSYPSSMPTFTSACQRAFRIVDSECGRDRGDEGHIVLLRGRHRRLVLQRVEQIDRQLQSAGQLRTGTD
jgi:alkanesulfonate monooxygenase SsuD/methylene tetrahydromethanopterin reductase-like flavin-dependent oxidoreductase (luciferase family)